MTRVFDLIARGRVITTSIAAYQIAQCHISPVIVTALTLQGLSTLYSIVAKAKFNHIIYNDIHVW